MTEVLDLLVRSIPILIGGGLVQFIIFLLRRRGEVRQLDAVAAKTDVEAQAIAVSSAAQSLALAGLMRDDAVSQVGELRDELEQRTAQTAALAAQLARVRQRLVRAEADVLVLQAEVTRLTHRDDP
jgi:hypothetical protein